MPALWSLVLLSVHVCVHSCVHAFVCMQVCCMVSLLITTLILSDQGPTLMTSSNLNSLKGLSFDISRLRI